MSSIPNGSGQRFDLPLGPKLYNPTGGINHPVALVLQSPASAPRPSAPPPVQRAPEPAPAVATVREPAILAALLEEARALRKQMDRLIEYQRLTLIGGPGAIVTQRTADIPGSSIAVGPDFTMAYHNDGRLYSVCVRVTALWNTPGGWVNIARVSGTDGSVTDYLLNGITDRTSSQIPLLPGDKLYLSQQPPAGGGVALTALDKLRVLVSDDQDLIAATARRFKAV